MALDVEITGANIDVPTVLHNPIGADLAKARNADLDDQYGLPAMGMFLPGRKARFLRLDSMGTLRGGDPVPRLHDPVELSMATTTGLFWAQSLTSFTLTAANGVKTLNAGASTTTTQGAMEVSLQRFERKTGRVLRWRQRAMMKWGTVAGAGTNGVIDHGFGAPASQTALACTDGVFFRVTAAGALTLVFALNTSETTLATLGTFSSGVITSDGSVTGFINGKSVRVDSYYDWEIAIGDDWAFAQIHDPETGDVIYERMHFAARTSIGFIQGSHVACFNRAFNSGAATTACQLLVSTPGTMVEQMDGALGMTSEDVLAGLQRGSNAVPTTQVQAANWANAAAPSTASLATATPCYTTMGGQFQFAAPTGAETDFSMFSVTVPSPYRFRAKKIKIDLFNTVVAVATTATVFSWFADHNATTGAQNSGTHFREPIGVQSLAVAAAVGAQAQTLEWTGNKVTEAGRVFSVGLKIPIGTNTATEIFRGTVTIEGQFE